MRTVILDPKNFNGMERRAPRMMVGLMVGVVAMVATTFQVTFAAPSKHQRTYEGWKVLEVEMKYGATGGQPQVELLDLDDTFNLQLLRQIKHRGVAEVALSPQMLPDFTQYLDNNNITYNSVLDNLARKLVLEGPSLRDDSLIPGT
ncbi:hypothetical protein OTU49_010185, partial [Cherax quadricarinatus]